MLIYLVLMLYTCRVQGEGRCLKQRELDSFTNQTLVHDKNEFFQARKHFEFYPTTHGTGSASCLTSHIFSSAEEIGIPKLFICLCGNPVLVHS